MKHFQRNKSVSVYGFVFDIDYYWTPATAELDGYPGDPPEVQINTINWTNSAGDTIDVTELILGFDRAISGQLKSTPASAILLTGIIEAIEKLEQ